MIEKLTRQNWHILSEVLTLFRRKRKKIFDQHTLYLLLCLFLKHTLTWSNVCRIFSLYTHWVTRPIKYREEKTLARKFAHSLFKLLFFEFLCFANLISFWLDSHHFSFFVFFFFFAFFFNIEKLSIPYQVNFIDFVFFLFLHWLGLYRLVDQWHTII